MTLNIQLVSPRESVEVHLPDGRVLCGPRGAPAAAFIRAIEETLPAPAVAAIINHELRELTYPIQMDCFLQPVTMADSDGLLVYRRSLTFLLETVFASHFPQAILFIDHSISAGGYYCHVKQRPPLTPQELMFLEAEMRRLVEADLPFERQTMPVEEAIAHFERKNYPDKVALLRHRRKPYVTLYRLGEHLDYHHGYMVPSTGYLKWFALTPTDSGFLLRFPRRSAPTTIAPPKEYPKLLTAFREYGEWLERLGIENVGSLNAAIEAGRSREIILVSEALHEQRIAEIARQIYERRDQVRIVLISGPSSSGKTTFSRRLVVQLLALGLSPFALELDNYFVDREKTPRDEQGNYDFEALEAVDLELLGDHLSRLIRGETVTLPRYDFKSGRRVTGETLRLNPDQLIILEGIHGLNPRLLPETLTQRAFRIYAAALTQLNLDRHNRVSTADTRLIRRIVRDARERGYSAQQTIARWDSVRRGEERYIFPYQENADVMFNSALVYELSALQPFAEPLLRQTPYGSPEYIEAKRLLAFLEWFQPIEADLIPDNSILREFIGGSILKDFRIWKA
ncbi:MAG: nucleoside kinase [Anaerolineales bacterium]|nr:nucleoside kinase [Anaerolineales bacterium]MCX7608591.1 nucleoside kinase [Anaerolineales bacterium]MDW8226648.1 nucleoside kinase [Anaerolineales bacterium]